MPNYPETPDVAELRRTLGLSIRNVLRAELGHEQPFDPHSWRCADKVRYPGPCGCADEVADMAVAAVVLRLLDRLAHMTEARDNARAEVERLAGMLDGRCLSDITHRDEEHRQSFCMLPADHAPLAHDDCMGCTWTDADHWQPQAVDRLADELRAVVDESQHEGWDSPAVRRVVERLTAAFDGGVES